jgi:hypothetical protein
MECRRSPILIAAVIASHGVFDLLQSHVVSDVGVAAWWPSFCMSYDVTGGLLLLLLEQHTKTGLRRVASAALALAITVLLPVAASARRSDTALHADNAQRTSASVMRRAEQTVPVIAIVADSAGTELTDFMIPHAMLTEAGIARVTGR